MIKEHNRFECDLWVKGEKHIVIASISATIVNQDKLWCTYVKIDPFLKEWQGIIGINSWQSMVLAIDFIRIFLTNINGIIYFKNGSEKIPLEVFFPSSYKL